MNECINTFQTAVKYTLTSKEKEQAIVDEIVGGTAPINATLYQSYADNLRRAVNRVFAEDDGSGLSDRLRANTSRFAAYKAYHATRLVREEAATGDARRVLHTFNRYQAAEYNTTVNRCRTAKQWGEFADPDHMRLFPNLRWLPSRSATPREEHIKFYNRVWAKTDPFWQQNQPGNLWNCKCDWEETDDPCTDGNPTTPVRSNGLDGNPALTGQVFTDKHAYFAEAGENRKERDRVEMACENAAHKAIKSKTKQHPLLQQTYECEIEGKTQSVHFADWGISETAYSMLGKKDLYWLKNEVLSNPERYFKTAKYVSSAEVDLTHNKGKVLRLKKKFKQYYYSEITLSNNTKAFLNIILHEDGYYYLYTISKHIATYE